MVIPTPVRSCVSLVPGGLRSGTVISLGSVLTETRVRLRFLPAPERMKTPRK